MPRISLSIVSPAVARFSAQHPDHHVSVDLRTRRDLELWIAGREYDLGIGNVPVPSRPVEHTPVLQSLLRRSCSLLYSKKKSLTTRTSCATRKQSSSCTK